MIRPIIGYLLIALLTCACRDQPPEPPQPLLPTAPVLLEVGERRLTLEQFQRDVAANYPEIATLPAPDKTLLKRQLIDQLIDRELIFAEATRLQIRISEDEFDAELAAIRGDYTAEEFDQVLRRTGRTPEAWRNTLKLQLLTAKVTAAVITPHIEVTDHEIEDYYRAHREDFRRPTEVSVHQMLFATRDAALEIRKLLQDGEDFATLARQHSLSPDGESGGALGFFSEGYLPPEFDAVIFRLPLQQVSLPVESPYGHHLFMVDSKRNAGLRSYAAVKDEIAEHLHQKKEEAVLQQWVRELRDKTMIKVDWQQIDPEHRR